MKTIPKSSRDRKNTIMILIAFVIILFLIIFAIVLHFQIASDQSSDSVRINLAGRQRMLTQKLSKEILQYSTGTIQKKTLEQTIKIFNTTLHALKDGGDAPLDLNLKKSIELPKMEKDSIKNQLLKVNYLWEMLKPNIIKYINKKDLISLTYIMQNNINILNEMDKAVIMMQNNAEINNHKINIILYITYFAVLLVFFFLIGIKLYQLKHASDYINRLESILPICANCKKIREPDAEPKTQNSWTIMESYIEKRSDSKFSHGLCPSCVNELYGDLEAFKKNRKKK